MAKQPRPTRGRAVREMVAAIVGKDINDDQYLNKKVYGRKGTKFEKVCGRVTNTSACTLEGCGGTRLHVLWPDGKRTYPCAKGCRVRKGGNLEIL